MVRSVPVAPVLSRSRLRFRARGRCSIVREGQHRARPGLAGRSAPAESRADGSRVPEASVHPASAPGQPEGRPGCSGVHPPCPHGEKGFARV